MDQKFVHLDEGFSRADANLFRIDAGVTEMRGKFDAAAAGQQQIVALLTTVLDDPGRDERPG